MIRMYFIFVFSCFLLTAAGQGTSPDLAYYIEVARNYSPLLNDYRNQPQIEQVELQRLKALYTRSRIELNGDYLFVPVITKDGGQTSFRWNAQDAIDYYGYDLGESSGHLHAGATWTRPLLGHSSYKVAQELSGINIKITRNNIRIEENQLERLVTEQYLLCLLDQTQIAFADSIAAVDELQQAFASRLQHRVRWRLLRAAAVFPRASDDTQPCHPAGAHRADVPLARVAHLAGSAVHLADGHLRMPARPVAHRRAAQRQQLHGHHHDCGHPGREQHLHRLAIPDEPPSGRRGGRVGRLCHRPAHPSQADDRHRCHPCPDAPRLGAGHGRTDAAAACRGGDRRFRRRAAPAAGGASGADAEDIPVNELWGLVLAKLPFLLYLCLHIATLKIKLT